MKRLIFIKGLNTCLTQPFSIPAAINNMELEFEFTESCKYVLPGDEQDDINKLCGFAFGLMPKNWGGNWIRPAHWNSMRIGWRWNPKIEKIELFFYWYENGIMYFEKAGETETNKKVFVWLLKHENVFTASINAQSGFAQKKHDSKENIGWMLPAYFGGSELCSQKIIIKRWNKNPVFSKIARAVLALASFSALLVGLYHWLCF